MEENMKTRISDVHLLEKYKNNEKKITITNEESPARDGSEINKIDDEWDPAHLDKICDDCGTIPCECQKEKNKDETESNGDEINSTVRCKSEKKLTTNDSLSEKTSTDGNTVKPLLSKNKAKQRLQAFSQSKAQVSPVKNKSGKVHTVVKQPKLVVSIETQYDENGEITEDTLVIRKPPKAGGNSQEKAKAVISEIEELKRHFNQNEMMHIQKQPASAPVVNVLPTKIGAQLIPRRNQGEKFDNKTKHHSSRSRDKYSSSRSERRYKDRSKSERGKSALKGLKSWAEAKKYGLQRTDRPLSYRTIPDPIELQTNMKMLLRNFEQEYLLRETYFIAENGTPIPTFYYKESVRRNSTLNCT